MEVQPDEFDKANRVAALRESPWRRSRLTLPSTP
jgi:hypothetical protein